jgi:hypothetical protein
MRRSRVRRARREPRRWSFLLAAFGLVFVLLVADAAWAGYTALEALRTTRGTLVEGSAALRDGDLEAARDALRDAEVTAGRAATFGQHPSVLIAGWLPYIGDDVQAVEAVARAAQLTASGGRSLVAAAEATGWTGEGVPAFESGGRIDTDAIVAARPGLASAADSLDSAVRALAEVDPGTLLAPLSDAFADAEGELARQSSLVWKARDLSLLLPPLLGQSEPRRYLLALQNLSAPRGTGGFLGFYGALAADDGSLTLETLQTAGDVPPVEPVALSPDAARRYGPFGMDTTLYAANYSPDVPTSSEAALEIADAAGIGPFDGVVWADTVWMADVLAAVGPVTSAGWPEPLTSDNLVDVMNRQIFLTEDPVASNAAQAQVGADIWTAVLTRPADTDVMASAMAGGVEGGHFSVYTRAEHEESLIEALGASGAFTVGPNPLAVVWQDAASNRAGYFARRESATSVTLDASGRASVETVVSLHNEAPTEPPSVLLGNGTDGAAVGAWGADIEVYLPAEATGATVKASRSSVIDVDEAFGRPVADCYLYTDPGETMSCTVGYGVPGAAIRVGDVWEYRLDVRPQAALAGVPASVTITVPEGARVVSASPGVEVADGVATWTGAPVAATSVWVRYEV